MYYVDVYEINKHQIKSNFKKKLSLLLPDQPIIYSGLHPSTTCIANIIGLIFIDALPIYFFDYGLCIYISHFVLYL